MLDPLQILDSYDASRATSQFKDCLYLYPDPMKKNEPDPVVNYNDKYHIMTLDEYIHRSENPNTFPMKSKDDSDFGMDYEEDLKAYSKSITFDDSQEFLTSNNDEDKFGIILFIKIEPYNESGLWYLDPLPFENELFEICTVGNLKKLRTIVFKDIDINIRSKRGNTPLMCAVCNGYSDLVRFLLHCNADPNV